MRYDVIVIGAGPAGSTTARECAHLGLSVLVLDKATFPRDKPCGGGVNGRAARLLPFDLTPVIEQVIYGTRITLRQAHIFTRREEQPLTYLTQRSRLDTFLLERALEAGVTLREGTGVTSIDHHDTHLAVHAGGETFEGRVLVAADGVNGQTAKMLGLEPKWTSRVAFEGNITPPGGGIPPEWQGLLGVDFGDVPGGYGWLFPKGDHLNIGAGGYRWFAPSLRERVHARVRAYGFDAKAMWGVRGYHIPVRLPDSPLVGDRAMLVGDAAGLADPLTGDGIYSAVVSGRAAARTAADYVHGIVPDLRGYQETVERTLVPDLRAGGRLHAIFFRAPGLYARLVRLPGVWRALYRVLQGEQTESALQGSFVDWLFSAFDWAVRISGRAAPGELAPVPNTRRA